MTRKYPVRHKKIQAPITLTDASLVDAGGGEYEVSDATRVAKSGDTMTGAVRGGGMAAVQEVSGSLKAPAALLGVIVAAALGVAGTLGVTGSAARSAPVPQPAPVISHDAALDAAQKAAQAAVAAQAQATGAALTRIEGKLDSQAAEIATVREGLAEIRGELKAKATRR